MLERRIYLRFHIWCDVLWLLARGARCSFNDSFIFHSWLGLIWVDLIFPVYYLIFSRCTVKIPLLSPSVFIVPTTEQLILWRYLRVMKSDGPSRIKSAKMTGLFTLPHRHQTGRGLVSSWLLSCVSWAVIRFIMLSYDGLVLALCFALVFTCLLLSMRSFIWTYVPTCTMRSVHWAVEVPHQYSPVLTLTEL